MFLRRSLAQYKYIYFLSVHFGVLPPQYQKAGYATDVDINNYNKQVVYFKSEVFKEW